MDFNNNFLHCFRRISENIEKNGNKKLKDLGLTLAQGQVLAYLFEKEDYSTTYKDLELVLNIAQSSTASLISRLESRCFIRTFTAVDDKRIKLLELTDLGKSCITSSKKCIDELKEELFINLSNEEVDTLMLLLKKIIN